MSTTEAEFDALAAKVREVVWARAVLHDLGEKTEKPTVVFEDNLVSISWTETVQGLRNVKHVGFKYQFVREHVMSKTVEIRYTPTEVNRADVFTKSLLGDLFHTHRKSVGVVSGILN